MISGLLVQPPYCFRFISTKGIFQISSTRMFDPYRRAEGIKHWPQVVLLCRNSHFASCCAVLIPGTTRQPGITGSRKDFTIILPISVVLIVKGDFGFMEKLAIREEIPSKQFFARVRISLESAVGLKVEWWWMSTLNLLKLNAN